jgi:hypothetical protein
MNTPSSPQVNHKKRSLEEKHDSTIKRQAMTDDCVKILDRNFQVSTELVKELIAECEKVRIWISADFANLIIASDQTRYTLISCSVRLPPSLGNPTTSRHGWASPELTSSEFFDFWNVSFPLSALRLESTYISSPNLSSALKPRLPIKKRHGSGSKTCVVYSSN